MQYFVVCTFDLENATARDYENAYADLAALGLTHELTSGRGNKIILPTTTTAGTFEGNSGGTLRDDITARVKKAIAARGVKARIFVSVGTNWAWGHSTVS